MIYDAHGRPVRRSIGFLREMVTERCPGEIEVHAVGYRTVDVDSCEAFEECGRNAPPAICR